MGCTSSKLDDLPAVALCRERCNFLDEAIHQRYSLAASHLSYINSLTSIGHSLHDFIQHDSTSSPSPPPPPQTISTTKHSSPSPPHSDSGHLHFHSDSDDDDGELQFHHHDDDHHHDFDSPPHKQHDYYNHQFHMNFAKNKPPPPSSIVYEHRPITNQTVYVGESSSSSSSYYNPYQQQPPPYPYPPYNNYDGYSNPPPPSSSFYGSSPPPIAPSSKPPPAPPSPPKTSTWDFLNFFENHEKYYPQMTTQQYTPTATPSRDSKDVREEEGIPDLEDEDEVVKQVHGDQKFVHPLNSNDHGHIEDDEEDESEVEYEVHVVDKKVVNDDDDKLKSKAKPNSAFRPGNRNPLEVAREIQILFQKASDSGSYIADILEVGKLRYHHKGCYYIFQFFHIIHIMN